MPSSEETISTRLFELAVEAAPNAIVIINAAGVIVMVNAQAEKLFGYAREELLGQRVEILVPACFRAEHPGKRDAFFNAPVARSMGAGRELFGLRKDGSEVPIEIGLNPIKTAEGAFALAAIIDITERRHAEMAVRRLAAIVESSDDAIISKDLNGIIQSWNKGAQAVFGYTAAEMIGRPMTFLFPPERFHEEEQILSRLQRGEVVDQFETVRIRKDGQRIDVSVTVSPIRDSVGRVVGASKIARDITNQKRILAELEISRRELRDMAENANVGLHWVDRQGIITWANQAELNLLGYSAEEYIGQPIARFHADPEVISDILCRLTRNEKLAGYEARMVAKDGSIKYVSIYSSVYEVDGQFKHTRCFTTDITSRKLLEDERDRFFANSLDLLCIAGADGFFRKVNPAFTRVLGYSEAELLASPLTDFVHPDDRVSTLAEVGKVSSGTSTIGFENRYRCADGSYRIFQWNAVKDPISALIHATARDVTEQREQLRMLALGKDVGLALTQGSALQVMLQDCAEAIVRHLDAAFARIWTLAESEDVLELQASAGMYTHLDGPHGKVPVGEFKIGLIAQERKPHLTNQVVADSGVGDQEWARREGMVAFAGHPLIVSGRLSGVVAMFSRHQLSSTVLSALNSIAHILAVGIDRKQAEEALVKSELEAKSATRAKSEFLANMSHEIRTPMNGVLGMTRLALETELTPLQREYLELANRSAESLLGIINDILDFSKIEAGKLSLDVIRFSLRDCLEDLSKESAIRAGAKGLELTCEIESEIPDALLGDPGRLRQVLINLIGNAIKFTQQGEVALSVKTLSQADDEVWLQFAVRDTGIGIPKDKLGRIFTAFEQADNSTKRIYGGTGLGLSISSKLVAMMGGTIEVESEMGVGSTFRFTAMFVPSEVPAEPSTIYSVPELGGLRVLVVDDNDTNRRILHDTLSHWNMRPVCVEGCDDALEALARAKRTGETFPLILLDAMMPNVDGFSLAQILRNERAYDGATIMMLSSADHQDGPERCRELGIQSYLVKPVTLSVLFSSIVHAMEFTRVKSGAEKKTSPAVKSPGLSPLTNTPPTTARLRVLVAEDNLVNQKLLLAMLRKLGDDVTIVGNGQEAVTALAADTYDVVLMDLQMPTMDGLEATAIIREREKTTGQHQPIIALTAHAMTGDRERCLEAGMDDYVSKPIVPEELKEALARTARQPAANRPTASPPKARDLVTFDRQQFLDRVGNDLQLSLEILKMFPTEVGRLMHDLQAAIQQDDSVQIRETAHTIKGLLGNVSAPAAFTVAERLEHSAGDIDKHSIDAEFRTLQEQIDQLTAAISEAGRELGA